MKYLINTKSKEFGVNVDLEVLAKNFDLILDAPNSVPKLREYILQLAVQGKLVPQDPNDEPASELLKKIKAEKDKLLAEGKIKKEKPLEPIKAADIPFDIPKNWEWVRLNYIGEINPRNNNISDDIECGFIPMTLINDGFKSTHSFEIKKWKEIKIGFTHFRNDDVVLAKITPCFQNRKSVVIKGLPNSFGAGTTELHVFRGYTNYLLSEFILFFFKSLNFINQGIEKMTGTAGQQRIPREYVSNSVFLLPPLEEQKRIVERVEQLMKYCDQLEEKQKEVQEKRINFNLSATHHLTNSENKEDFNKYLQLINDNFDFLYDEPKNVKQLRETILQLAVQGKLVPQNPKDEPASELLKKIKAEKDKLIAEGKIKKEKPLEPIKAADIPFNIPKSWEWVKLNDICFIITDGTHHTPTYVDKGIPFLSVKDVSKGFLNFANTRFISIEEHKILTKRCNPEFEDILFTKVGTTGIAKVIDKKINFSIFVSLSLLKISKINIHPYFLEYLLNSPFVKKQSDRDTMGIGNKNLVLKYIKEFLVVFPPLEEQKRIVARVEQLMKYCDELEANIEKSNKDRQALMYSVLSSSLKSKTKELSAV